MSRVDLVVLGLLTGKPVHGYEIISYFERKGIEMWTRVKTPSVYKALQRLENKKCITGEIITDETNPPRKVFCITDAGRKYFHRILEQFLFDNEKAMPYDFWNALRFVPKNIPKEKFIAAVIKRKNYIDEREKTMKCRMEKALADGVLNPVPFFSKTIIKMHKQFKSIEKETLDELLTEAEKNSNADNFTSN